MFGFFLFLAPYARTTRYEEAFLPKGNKWPRSLRSLDVAFVRFIPDFVLFDGFIYLWNSLLTRKKNAQEQKKEDVRISHQTENQKENVGIRTRLA